MESLLFIAKVWFWGIFLLFAWAPRMMLVQSVGGWHDDNPESQEIKELLPLVMAKLNQQSNVQYLLKPVKVLKVSSHVVAGLEYNMEVQVAPTECKKSGSNGNVDLNSCKKLAGQPDQVYSLNVKYRAWENFVEVKILGTKTLS